MGPGIIVTPQTMLDYLNEVNRYIRALNLAVAPQAQKLPGVTLTTWWDFLAQWNVFYEAHKDGWNVSGSVADTTERYETDATLWRAQFVKLGLNVDGVVFDPSKKPGGAALEPLVHDVADAVKWIALLGFGAWFLTRRGGAR